MRAKWYYAENGESVGPTTCDEIIKRIEREPDQPHLIWTADMPGLTAPTSKVCGKGTADSAGLDLELQAKNANAAKSSTLAQRARNEVIEYLAIAAHLAVCFGALLFYKATILESEGIDVTRVGIAVVKALILGKFVLILEKLRIGGGWTAGIFLLDILKKALLFTLLLIVLTAVEEAIVAYVHGESALDAVKAIGGGTRPEALATALLMFLILIPYFAYREIAAKLGEGAMLKLLLAR